MTEPESSDLLPWLPATAGKAQMAALLGVSLRTIGDLSATGTLVPAAQRGHFQVLPSLHRYHQRLREAAAGRGSTTALTDERARREAIEREMAEIKLAALKGEVLSLDEVTEEWGAFAKKARAMFLAFPSKARSTIPHLTPHDQETLRQLVVDALTQLAEEIEMGLIGADPEPMRPTSTD